MWNRSIGLAVVWAIALSCAACAQKGPASQLRVGAPVQIETQTSGSLNPVSATASEVASLRLAQLEEPPLGSITSPILGRGVWLFPSRGILVFRFEEDGSQGLVVITKRASRQSIRRSEAGQPLKFDVCKKALPHTWTAQVRDAFIGVSSHGADEEDTIAVGGTDYIVEIVDRSGRVRLIYRGGIAERQFTAAMTTWVKAADASGCRLL